MTLKSKYEYIKEQLWCTESSSTYNSLAWKIYKKEKKKKKTKLRETFRAAFNKSPPTGGMRISRGYLGSFKGVGYKRGLNYGFGCTWVCGHTQACFFWPVCQRCNVIHFCSLAGGERGVIFIKNVDRNVWI